MGLKLVILTMNVGRAYKYLRMMQIMAKNAIFRGPSLGPLKTGRNEIISDMIFLHLFNKRQSEP